MKRMAIFAVSAFLLAAGGVWARAEDAPAVEKDKTLAASLLSRIDAYHNGAPRNGRVLHIVYFHPADVEPQPLFRERLTRIMLDIQDFYRSEMKRNGFGERVFPLDVVDGQLRIRVVKGKDPASAYSYESGGKVRGEIQRALAGTLQLNREYVLIFNGMCRKVAENDYFVKGGAKLRRVAGQKRGTRCLCTPLRAGCQFLSPRAVLPWVATVETRDSTGIAQKSLCPGSHAILNCSSPSGLHHRYGRAA